MFTARIGRRRPRWRVHHQAAPDEQQQLAPAGRIADRLGNPRDGLEDAQPAQATAIAAFVQTPREHARFRAPVALHDRFDETAAVGGEVLRRVDAARRDERTEVVGPERLDGGDGDLLRQDRRALVGDRPIHQDDDQAPVLLTDLIGDDVGRRLVGPHRLSRTRARGELHWRERADGCRDAVVEHGEIRCGQPADGLALVVEDGHIELDQLDAGSKLGEVALSLRQKTHRRQGEEHDQAESGHTHRYSSRGRDRGR